MATASWFAFSLLFAAQATSPDSLDGHVISACLFALALVGAWRAYRGNTIVATSWGLEIRRFARTYRWAWSEIRSVRVAEHVNGFRGKGELIEVEGRDRTLRLREFFWLASDTGKCPAEGFVRDINSVRPTS